MQHGTKTDAFEKDGSGYGESSNLVTYSDKMTHYLLPIAEGKSEQYIQKATKKQADKIVERFNAGKK